jgi:hypothetical protein
MQKLATRAWRKFFPYLFHNSLDLARLALLVLELRVPIELVDQALDNLVALPLPLRLP